MLRLESSSGVSGERGTKPTRNVIVPQTLIVPMSVAQNATVVATGSQTESTFIHLQKNFEVHGTFELRQDAQVILGGDSSTAASTSTTVLEDTCSLYVDGKSTRWLGRINEDKTAHGSLIIQTAFEFTSNIFLSEVFMLGDFLAIGSASAQASHAPSITVSSAFHFDSGRIVGAGTGPTRIITLTKGAMFTIDDKTSTKQIQRVMIDLLQATMEFINNAAIDYSHSTFIRLSPASTVTVYPGTQVTQSTPNEPSMLILGDNSTINFHTSINNDITFDMEIRGSNEFGTVYIHLPPNVLTMVATTTTNTNTAATAATGAHAATASIVFTKPVTSKYLYVQNSLAPTTTTVSWVTSAATVRTTLAIPTNTHDGGSSSSTASNHTHSSTYTQLLLQRIQNQLHSPALLQYTDSEHSMETLAENITPTTTPFYTLLLQHLLPRYQGKT
uniref:Uncharacterized protein n=1 Tax=Lygus hesperus TaxID=30085 RepID=A0A0A9YMB0_LYGHE